LAKTKGKTPAWERRKEEHGEGKGSVAEGLWDLLHRFAPKRSKYVKPAAKGRQQKKKGKPALKGNKLPGTEGIGNGNKGEKKKGKALSQGGNEDTGGSILGGLIRGLGTLGRKFREIVQKGGGGGWLMCVGEARNSKKRGGVKVYSVP